MDGCAHSVRWRGGPHGTSSSRGSPRRRAALYAAAAAIVWALVATFIKTATETLSESGVPALFTDWPVYALAAGGAAGIVLVQAALHVGPLSVSQPLLVIVDPSVSVILSVWLFQERYSRDPGGDRRQCARVHRHVCGGYGPYEDRTAYDAGRIVPVKSIWLGETSPAAKIERSFDGGSRRMTPRPDPGKMD
jgi:hypothetical protein